MDLSFLLLFDVKAPCRIANYELGIQTYDDLSTVSLKKELDTEEEGVTNSSSEVDTKTTIMIYYATTDINVSSTSELIDLSTFISNVGGNLGLFVGFSVLGGVFYIYDVVALYLFSRIAH